MVAIQNLEPVVTSHEDVRQRLQAGESVTRHLSLVPPAPERVSVVDALIGSASEVRQRIIDTSTWYSQELGRLGLVLAVVLVNSRITGPVIGPVAEAAHQEAATFAKISTTGVLAALVANSPAGIAIDQRAERVSEKFKNRRSKPAKV